MGKTKRLAINLCLLCASIVAGLFLCEIVLRLAPVCRDLPSYNDFRKLSMHDPLKGVEIKKNLPKRYIYVGPESKYEVKYEFWSNELGCFDRPYNGEKRYILLVGDSFTHCYAPFPDKWGTRLEDLLGCRVLKCGIISYGTKQELLKAKEIVSQIKTSPRLIIIGYFMNDLSEDLRFSSGPTRYPELLDKARVVEQRWRLMVYIPEVTYGIKKWCAAHSSLFYFLKYYLRPLIIKTPIASKIALDTGLISADEEQDLPFYNHPYVENAWKQHFNNLREFKEFAHGLGAELLVVIIPMKEQVYPFLKHWNVDRERPNKILREFFTKERIPYLDLLPLFMTYSNQKPRDGLNPKKDFYWHYDGHFSIQGEHLTGLLVSRYILEDRLIEVEEREKKLMSIEGLLQEFSAQRTGK